MSILEMTHTARDISPDELRRMEDEAGIECINGEIVEKPVSFESSKVEMSIGSLLRIAALKCGTAQVLSSTRGYKCDPEDPTRFRKPDISVILNERIAGLDIHEGFLYIPAD